MVLAAPARTLERDGRACTCASQVDKSDRTGSFLGGEGSQTQREVPGSPTPNLVAEPAAPPPWFSSAGPV